MSGLSARRVLAAAATAALLATAPAAEAAYTASLNGSQATLTDAGTAATNVAVYADGGLLAHTLTSAGFASAKDWDTTAAGEQTLPNTLASSVTFNAGGGDDGASVGREPLASAPAVPGSWAGAIGANVTFNGQDGTDRLAIDNAGETAARGYIVAPAGAPGAMTGQLAYGTVEELRVLGGTGNDTIDAVGLLPKTTVQAGPGDDRLRFADAATLSGGIADGGAGTDTLDYSPYGTPVSVDLGKERAFAAEPMTGANERPTPNTSRSTGTMLMRYDGTSLVCDLDTASRHFETSRMTGAHLHRAGPDAAGPIIVNLDGNASGNLFTMLGGLTTRTKGFTLPAAEADDLLAGNVYVNLHSTTFTGGEIRAQVLPSGQAGPATGTGWQARFERATGGVAGDTLRGGDGPNELRGGNGADQLLGGPGDDTLLGEEGDDTLTPGTGRDTADGGSAGADTLSYADRVARVAVKLDGVRNDGTDTSGNGVSSSTEEADLDVGIEHATAGAGNDQVTGGGGVNVLAGGLGNDLLDGGLGGDTLDGGGGTDTITYAARTGPVAVTIDKLRNDGADPNVSGVSTGSEEGDLDIAIENVTGGSDSDLIRGSNGNNVLLGGPGDDRLTPRLGRDTVNGGTGSDGIVYRERTAAVAVTLDGLRNDGLDPNGDGLSATAEEADQDIAVEEAEGGSAGDRLRARTADTVVNRLFGHAGNDLLETDDGTITADELYCGEDPGEEDVDADSFLGDETDIVGEDCEVAG